MIQTVDYTKYFGFFILGFCHLMLHILYQIYIFYNSRLGSFSRDLHTSNYIIRTKFSRCILIKPDSHQPVHLWLLSSSQYPDYSMKKLTFFTKREGQLHLTSFSTSPPTMMLKGGKFHTLTSR